MAITDGQSMAMYMWEHYYSKHQMPPELGTKGQVLASDGDKLVWETPAVPETVGINSFIYKFRIYPASVTVIDVRIKADGVISAAKFTPMFDMSRNVVITAKNNTSDRISFTVTITGLDINGNTISDVLTITELAAGAQIAVAGVKAFTSVTKGELLKTAGAYDGNGIDLSYSLGTLTGLPN